MSDQTIEASLGPRVLLVGDPAARPDGLERVLTNAGFHLLERQVAGPSPAADAILITLTEVLKSARGDFGLELTGTDVRVPRIVVLSSPNPDGPTTALDLGAADALAAPVHLPELCARLYARIREYRSRPERVPTSTAPDVKPTSTNGGHSKGSPETTAVEGGPDALERRVREEFERARRYSLSFSLILLAIDDLHSVADRMGVEAAAQLREIVSQKLRRELRMPDLVVPFGAEEFAIVLPETGESGARQSVVRLRERLTSLPLESDPRLDASRFSAGIVTYPHPAALQTDDLFAMAEAALMRGRVQVGERIGVAM